MSKDLWIIAVGFIAAMHIGKLSATLPILQQQMHINLVRAGLSIIGMLLVKGLFKLKHA